MASPSTDSPTAFQIAGSREVVLCGIAIKFHLVSQIFFGKAVIGTRQGGVPDAVVDGVTGILVEPGNVKQLAEAMLFLIENKEIRDRMGQDGRKRAVREFGWYIVADKLSNYVSGIK